MVELVELVRKLFFLVKFALWECNGRCLQGDLGERRIVVFRPHALKVRNDMFMTWQLARRGSRL